MKEKTRHSLLSAIGWRKAYRLNRGGPVYVPMAIQMGQSLPSHISINRALAMGATNITVDDDCYSLQAKWPYHYFSAEAAEARKRFLKAEISELKSEIDAEYAKPDWYPGDSIEDTFDRNRMNSLEDWLIAAIEELQNMN